MRGKRWPWWLAAACWTVSAAAQVRFAGKVSNENRAPVPGARLTLQTPAGQTLEEVSDVRGEFVFKLQHGGAYRLSVEKEAYFPIRDQEVLIEAGQDEAELTLERVREIFESVEVTAAPPAIDMSTTSAHQGVTGNDVINIPYPNTNDFRQALRIIPGVTRDPKGRIHIHGGGEDQVMYTLNGFNVTDPLSGRFESRLSVDSVQEVEISSGNLSAEYGKGSAGTLAVRTHSGDDQLRYSATNFVPGVENRKGLIIGDWTPRLNVSGPFRRGRAWFSDSVDTVYTKTVIEDRPKGEDRMMSWRVSNLLHTQVNLTPSNILYSGFLLNAWTAPRTGLGALDPVETTIDRRTRQWFFYVKDQIYLGRRAVLELGYAANRTFGREIPQGQEIFRFTAEGRRGNHFADALRKASRDQLLVNGFFPSFTALGDHQLKGGIDLDYVSYWQDVRRTGFENFSEAGFRVRRTVFGGSGQLERSNYEAALFLQDSWRVRPGLLLELGARADWGNILRRWDVSPRLGVAWSPPWWENTKLFGGFARIFDASNLRVFTRPLDQHWLTTYFHPSGEINRGPAISIFTIQSPRLKRPHYLNWTFGAERQWLGSFATRLEFLRRRGTRGFSYLNTTTDGAAPSEQFASRFQTRTFDAIYDLTNERRDRYDSVAFTLRQNIRRQYEWMVSYTLSRALSNTVVDLNVDDPISVIDNIGRMPWDAPHRLLSWGYLPTFWKNWAVAYMVEARTGFPFSIQSDDGAIIEGVNSRRFPFHFEANLHLERRFSFRGHRWALRFGANNITNRRNPDTVNNLVGSSRFLQFYGGTRRAFNVRIRWLGRN